MGETATCTLWIKGLLNEKYIDEIADYLKDEAAEIATQKKFPSIKAALQSGEYLFVFYDVNQAQMCTDLADALSRAKLSYNWTWDTSSDFPAGMEIYDAFKDGQQAFNIIGEDVVVPLAQARDPALLSVMEEWDSFSKDTGFATYKSNHELLKIQSESKINARYFALHQSPG